MAPVNLFLKCMGTPRANKARPTLGERLKKRAKDCNWPAECMDKLSSAGSPQGGGHPGHVVTRDVLKDAYDICL